MKFLPSIPKRLMSSMALIVSLAYQTTSLAETPNLVNLNLDSLETVKQQLNQDKANALTTAAYNHLIEQANTILGQPLESVIQKGFMPPSGDIHDYLSLSRYWWPDESKKNGLPWIRRDGQTNPDTQTDKVDRPRLGRMSKNTSVLSLAYYFSGDDRYAKRASNYIRTWFLNDKTKMNPHLTYAQTVPGNPKPRRSGILDGRLIPKYVLDSIELIKPSGHWSEADDKAMKDWLNDYMKWIVKSKVGKDGSNSENNHGSWYFFQVAALADYLDHDKNLDYAFKRTRKLLKSQFKNNGSQPKELARTRTFSYSCFNMEALSHIAFISERHDQSLWDFPSSENSVLQKGIDYVSPAIFGEPWPHKTPGVDATHCLKVLSGSVTATKQNKQAASAALEAAKNSSVSLQNDYYTLVLTSPALFQ